MMAKPSSIVSLAQGFDCRSKPCATICCTLLDSCRAKRESEAVRCARFVIAVGLCLKALGLRTCVILPQRGFLGCFCCDLLVSGLFFEIAVGLCLRVRVQFCRRVLICARFARLNVLAHVNFAAKRQNTAFELRKCLQQASFSVMG